GTGSAKVALTEAIKSLSNVSGREADVPNICMVCFFENKSHCIAMQTHRKYNGRFGDSCQSNVPETARPP
ncbi:hypothetical protein, partial [Klebsiella variicola]